MTFHERLCGLMRAKGLISTANKSGVDVRALAKAAGTTYEMARRYVDGRAIPRADKLDKVAAWLGVSPQELLYGDDHLHRESRIIHTEALQTCIKAVRQAEEINGERLPAEKAARLVALLYEEAIDGREVSAGLLTRFGGSFFIRAFNRFILLHIFLLRRTTSRSTFNQTQRDKEVVQMNVYQRINEVRRKIGYVQKDKSVSTGGSSYKAVTHDQVTGMVRAHLIEQGVVIVPDTVAAVFHQKEQDAKQRLYEATYLIHFVNMDQPDERISLHVNAHALDNGDKAPGKALSYATKYAILKLFSIETGEDEESRYQQDEFDLEQYAGPIRAAATIKELQDAFGAAFKAASNARDNYAVKQLTVLKDERKKALMEAAK